MIVHLYTFRIFQFTPAVTTTPPTSADAHFHVATYENLPIPPWVPPIGSYFRHRDPSTAAATCAGRVAEVVTVFYGTRTTIEIYLKQ